MPTITFIPINESVMDLIIPPMPANKTLPEWYKQQGALTDNKLSLNEQGNANTTIKKCMPVFDDMTAGYHILLSSDVLITQNENVPLFQWSLDLDANFNAKDSNNVFPPLISTHSTGQVSALPIYIEYSEHPFKFNNYFRISTPEGYSCLFRHPAWHTELPFFTLSGIVDTDKHPIPVNFPFFIRKNYEGIIEAGTPIAQVIPFLREDWDHVITGDNNYDGDKEFRRTTQKLMHRYKDNWRTIKLWK